MARNDTKKLKFPWDDDFKKTTEEALAEYNEDSTCHSAAVTKNLQCNGSMEIAVPEERWSPIDRYNEVKAVIEAAKAAERNHVHVPYRVKWTVKRNNEFIVDGQGALPTAAELSEKYGHGEYAIRAWLTLDVDDSFTTCYATGTLVRSQFIDIFAVDDDCTCDSEGPCKMHAKQDLEGTLTPTYEEWKRNAFGSYASEEEALADYCDDKPFHEQRTTYEAWIREHLNSDIRRWQIWQCLDTTNLHGREILTEDTEGRPLSIPAIYDRFGAGTYTVRFCMTDGNGSQINFTLAHDETVLGGTESTYCECASPKIKPVVQSQNLKYNFCTQCKKEKR